MFLDPLKKMVLGSIVFVGILLFFYINYLQQENKMLEIDLQNEKTKTIVLQEESKIKNFENNLSQEKIKLKSKIQNIDSKKDEIVVQKIQPVQSFEKNDSASSIPEKTIKINKIKDLPDGNYILEIK